MHCLINKKKEKFGALAYRISEYTYPLQRFREGFTIGSGVKHLEEIREAGYPTPTVNQVEVR